MRGHAVTGRAWGINIGPCRVMLKSASWFAMYSERNQLGVRVLPLPKGWRITFRRRSA